MKRIVLYALMLLLCRSFATAQIPRSMSYQGVLTDSTGVPKPDGNYEFTFRLYDASSGGNLVGTQTQTLQVARGLFHTVLDQLLQGVRMDRPYWLSLQLAAEAELSPRIPLTAVAYSFSSIHADTARYAINAAGQGGVDSAGSGWSLSGNASTADSIFIGTLDARPFDIRTNNTWHTRITTKGQIETYNTGGSVFLGMGTGANDDLQFRRNVFVGEQAGTSTTSGIGNSGIGYQALFSNTTGSFNATNGWKTLFSNTTGNENVAMGYVALYHSTTGLHNVAVGGYALYENTNGGSNAALGHGALLKNVGGSYNAAVGTNALYANTGGSNAALGYQALMNNVGGSFNTAVGTNALWANNGGSYNTASGVEALFFTTNSQYNTAVGYHAGRGYDNGYNNVFIGANVDVNGTGYFNVIAVGQGTIVGGSSTARFGNSATVSYGGWAGWSNVSDGRFKKNVKSAVPGLAFITKLRPITYSLDATALDAFLHQNSKPDPTVSAPARAEQVRALQAKEAITYTGFVAQEVEGVAKELGYDFSGVDAPKNANDYYALRYAEFVVPLVKAVQEQQQMIDAQQKEINELKAIMQSLSQTTK